MRKRTQRLLLRDFEAADWQAVQAYAANPEAVRYRPFGPCTDEEREAAIAEAARQASQPHRTLFDLAIVLADENQSIGGCDIGLLADNPAEAALGYGLSRACWGQGYMTEAARTLLEIGFEELKVERTSADVEPANIASVRVLEKIGMRCNGQGRLWLKGEHRTVLHYAITAKERQAALQAPTETNRKRFEV